MASSLLLEESDEQTAMSLSVAMSIKHHRWDPEISSDWDQIKPKEQCYLRIKRDIMSIYKDPSPGMCIIPDKDDMTRIHALITGPFDTPYEGGFFYFLIRVPPDYPIKAPRMKLMTTGSGQVRFNPNLYKNGKVCLSMLGTWSGPCWSPANSISSVLISVQSLLNDKPYHNEPGFEKERNRGDCERYNDIIRHETLRVAVCDMLEQKDKCPHTLREVMEKSFSEFYEYYKTTCENNMHLTGQEMQDPFGGQRGVFNYKSILGRLEKLREMYCREETDSSSDLDDDDPNSDSDTEFNKTEGTDTNNGCSDTPKTTGGENNDKSSSTTTKNQSSHTSSNNNTSTNNSDNSNNSSTQRSSSGNHYCRSSAASSTPQSQSQRSTDWSRELSSCSTCNSSVQTTGHSSALCVKGLS